MQNTIPKPFVFVLMPFAKTFDDIYELGIKAACENSGAYCERIDEQIYEGSITDRLFNQIAKADVIVAEMTGRNPNVFYETGYAHALGKNVILLAQNQDEIPFDLVQYPHIIYGAKITKLKLELEKRITWMVDNPKKELSDVDITLKFYIENVCINENQSVIRNIGKSRYSEHLNLTLTIHNSGNKSYSTESFRLGLITPELFSASKNTEKSAKLPTGNYIHFLERLNTIFPESWESLNFKLLTGGRGITIDNLYDFNLCVFTKIGTKNFPFSLKVTSSKKLE